MGWGEQFFRAGWKGQPWVVVDQRPVTHSEAEFRAILARSEETEGWVFGLTDDSVIHAPTFGIVASDEVQLRIIAAIEAYPARRVAEFELAERPAYERRGWPREVIEHATPSPDAQLRADQFNWPILLTSEEGRHFVGRFVTWDTVLGTLVRCRNIPIDVAAAIRILYSCHGDPGMEFEKTPFSAPFHPAEFRGLAGRLHGRCPGDPKGELLRVLAQQVPAVMESLRRKPPKPERLYAVARRRLATAGSTALWPTRRRRVHDQPRCDPDERLRSALRDLTTEQRVRVDEELRAAPIQAALVKCVENGGSSFDWWRGRSKSVGTSTLRRMRQEVLKKVARGQGNAE